MTLTLPSLLASIRSRPLVGAVMRNLGWLLASRSVLGILSLFYLGFATRSLGVVDFGRFALITGSAQAITTLVGFQTWQIIVQYGVEPLQKGQTERLARLLRGAWILDILSAVAGIALAALILLTFGERFGIPTALKRDTLIFAIVTLVSIRSTPLGILRLRDRFSLASLADSMTPIARFVGSTYAVFFDPTIHGFLIAWGGAELVTAASYWLLVARSGDLALLGTARTGYRALVNDNPGIVGFALSTNASATLGLSSKQIPLLLVGAVVSPSAAGVFRLASQVAQALSKITQLLARAAFPEVVRLARVASPQRLGEMLPKMYFASAVAAVAIMALVALGGGPVLSLIGGSSFRDAYPMLLWLTAAGCVELVLISAETVMTALNRAGLVFAIRSAGAGVMLTCAMMLMPKHEATGAAVSVLLGSATVALLLGAGAAWITRVPARVAPDGS